jgi:hypothetical protein
MSVDYRKVIGDLTDVIKELNVGFAPCGAAAAPERAAAPASRRGSAEQRRADAVDFLKALVGELEQGAPPEGADAAVAEHGSASAGNKNIANILFGKETPTAEATSATKVQVTLKGDVGEREVRSGAPGMPEVLEGGGRTGPRSPPRGGGAPRVLCGDGGGRLDALEVGLDCALDGGELDVVGAAHFFLFFRGKKRTVKKLAPFLCGPFFFFFAF